VPAVGPGPSSLNAPQLRRWPGPKQANETLSFMKDTERSPDSIFERKQRLEAAMAAGLQQEAARHEAAVKNMHRLRALRLERDQKAKGL
jgi:hypothetical protein